MADCDVPFIDCDTKELTVEELLKLLVVKLPDGSAALRSCGCGCESGLNVEHFSATPGQTVFALAAIPKGDYLLTKDGAVKQASHSQTGPQEITMDNPQAEFTEITITY
jgi:hypothetical protein